MLVPVKGYEGCYSITPDGVVYSLKRKVRAPDGQMRTIPFRRVKEYKREDRKWRYVKLSKDGFTKEHGVDRLIQEHFPKGWDMIKPDMAAWVDQVLLDLSTLRVTIDSNVTVAAADRDEMLGACRKISLLARAQHPQHNSKVE